MTLQIKLENIFKNLVETEQKFGPNNKFIALKVNNLDGSTSNDDDLGKVYLGVLKLYHILENKFRTVDLFIKIESKEIKQSKDDEGQIIYDFKFNNECVAYKYILPTLNKSFNVRHKEFVDQSLRTINLNGQADNAYTIAEFKNDTRYKEIGNVNRIRHRYSWNPSYHEKLGTEKFFTIRPNSNIALDKCDTYRQINERANEEILTMFPKYYHGEFSDDRFEDNIVVIENMLPAGFHTSNEAIFLNKERVLLTLKALGKFHASSYIAKHDNPKEFTSAVRKLKPTGWTVPQYWDIYPNFLDEHLQRGIKHLRKDPKYEKKVSKFQSMLKNPKELFFSILDTDEKIAVICHGDFCKNNILYRYDKRSEFFSKLEANSSDITLKALGENNYKSDSREENKIGKLDNEAIQTNSEPRCVETTKKINEKCHVVSEGFEEKSTIEGSNGRSQFCNANLIMFKDKLNRADVSKKNTEGPEAFLNTADSLVDVKSNKKENKEDHINDISKKRKEFLNHILATNYVSYNTESKNSYFQEEKKQSERPETSNVHNSNISQTANEDFLKNKKQTIKLNHTNFKSSYRTICCSRPVLKHSVSLNDSYPPKNKVDPSNRSISLSETRSKSVTENHERTFNPNEGSTNKENDAISDRLNFLEDKYKELEKIYNVNQCVLERRRVNNKIIEKLNEKKEILEEICKRIEKINTKQDMENKIQRSITKLYQNLDDLNVTKKSNTILKESTNGVPVRTTYFRNEEEKEGQNVLNHKCEGETKPYNVPSYESLYDKTKSQTNEPNRQNLHRSQSLNTNGHRNLESFSVIKDNQKFNPIKSVDEEFESIYEELFSKENLTEYETLFSELTKKDNEYIKKSEDTLTIHNDMTYISEKKTVERKTHERVETNIQESSKDHNTETEYYTLSVKQRRDNLERTISLENGLTSSDNSRKVMKRSNTDINVMEINKPLISERNITLNEQISSDEFEKETLKRELLKSAFNKSRARFFTGSSLSINEDEETEEDEVFEEEINRIGVENVTTLDPLQKKKDDMKRSSSLANFKKPVPMKRTISLIHKTKSTHDGSFEQIERETSRYNKDHTFLYGISEPIVQKKHVSLLGFTDGHDKRDIKTQYKAFTLPRTTLESTKNPNEYSKAYYTDYPKRSFADTSTLPRKSKITSFATLENYRDMEKKTKDTPTDLVFFDLARMIYASPVIDLSFFLFLNVSDELRVECWDEFISTYYSSLVENTLSHVHIPSRGDLELELKRKAVYGYFLCCFFLPWMMEENPQEEVQQWIHNGGEAGSRAVGNILKFLIDRDYV